MRPELSARRRVLRLTFQRYIEADREWRAAMLEVKRWFPGSVSSFGGVIGDPGSRVRKVYDARMRALLQFEAARLKFEMAKRKLERSSQQRVTRIILLT